MGRIKDGVRSLIQSFVQLMPEDANRKNSYDGGNVAKTSPWLFDYDVFKINWHKVDILRNIDEMVKEDARIKRANHIFASTAVRRGLSIKVSSNISESLAEQAQEVTDDFVRRVQLNSKLTPWARSLLKDGELFLNPVVNPTSRLIIDVKNLPAITMQRNEDITGRFTDLNDAFRQIDPVSREILGHFPLWSVNHIRYDHEAGQLYGNSQYMGCLSIWRKLKMTEEDLVVRRRTRAVPRRLHIVGNKDNPQEWSEIDRYKTINKLNGKQSQVATDYFGNGLTDIKDLNADAHLDHIKDIEYLQDLMMIGTGVPLHLLGSTKNLNRDIVEDQKKQFDESVQELRDLLENGDESTFSGLRAILDFQLKLQGIDPELVDYNFLWSENNEDTIDQKVDRVVKLRAAQPAPLISRETALSYLGRDMNLENQEAVEAEIEKIKEERAEALKEQQSMLTDLNPEKPSSTPTDRTTSTASGKPTMDNVNPLHSDKVVELEKSLADDIRGFFGAVWSKMKDDGIEARLDQVRKLKPHFDSAEPMSEDTRTLMTPHAGHCKCGQCMTDKPDQVPLDDIVEQHVIDQFDEAWQYHADDEEGGSDSFNFKALLIKAYLDAGTMAYDFVNQTLDDAGVGVRFDFVHSGVKSDLEHAAGERIKGIEETTKQMLRVQLAEAYENGESLQEWMDRIEGVIEEIPEWRSSMIARTEVSWAFNRANMAAYNQAGVTQVKYVAVLDARTCPVCKSNASGGDGGVYDIGEVPAIPAHPRCRCTTIAVI